MYLLLIVLVCLLLFVDLVYELLISPSHELFHSSYEEHIYSDRAYFMISKDEQHTNDR